MILSKINKAHLNGRSLFAVLIDPDKYDPRVLHFAKKGKADMILVGGSGLKKNKFTSCIRHLRKHCRLPLVIFPGGREQVSKNADALLLLSLISGRNPDYLIGEHIRVADKLRSSGLEIIPTGYILMGAGRKSTTQKVSKTKPIPIHNRSLISSTAIAGELLGMKLIYLEAGSGSRQTIPIALVKSVRAKISVPIVAGGGVDSPEKAIALAEAGITLIVAGNAIERNPKLAEIIGSALNARNHK